MKSPFNKLIFNDPIYGFISIPDKLIFDLIQHPYFQRLRRIRQLGLTYLVFPGATHTRFQHAMGAMYLMGQALHTLRSKGHDITPEEEQAVTIAILLHDIGHGPFSHVLENSIVNGVSHEDISALMMQQLNKQFNGQLSLAIKIFNNKYKKNFLHQLVSGQLDMDRMDYLKRDSFYSGVSEGIISWERILIMLDVVKGELSIDVKGIYPVEKFIIARRLMYWQVYLHKTVLAAEILLVNILKRAKELACGLLSPSPEERGQGGEVLFATPALEFFLYNNISKKDFSHAHHNSPLLRREEGGEVALDKFSELDDYDIFTSIKVWASHSDKILSTLCRNMISRNLARVELQNQKFSEEKINFVKKKVKKHFHLNEEEVNYFVFAGSITNSAYNPEKDKINILMKDGRVKDIADASDQGNIFALAKPVVKYYLCYPKGI